MGIIDGATTGLAKATAGVAVVTSTAAGLAALGSGVKNAFSALTGGGATSAQTLPVKLPLPNLLFSYASYTYVLSLGCLSHDEYNNPDKTYKAGKTPRLVCKSANADPSNRVNTPYGKFDFFIDNVEMKSTIGLDEGNNTNVTNLSFKVTEPYSMGMFIIACQQVAQELGHDNWRDAPFLLTIEFRGNKETGQMQKIPGTTRHIPFNFSNMTMRVTQDGSTYNCTGMPYNQQTLADDNNLFKTDVSAKGTTVQEVLQTGEKSLQVVINQRYKDLVEKGIVSVADEVVILFPQDTASSTEPSSSSGNTEDKSGATTGSTIEADQALFEKLGVARSTKNQTLVQQDGDCNILGKADMGFSETRPGDTVVGKDNKLWDPDKQVFIRGSNTINIKEGNFKFSQNTDIVNAINQVLLASDYAGKTALDAANISAEGMRGWWRIDLQTYIIPSTANLKKTGQHPKLFVYRVVPYDVHASRLMPPNTKAPGFDQLKLQAVKEYNYIYTGKNVDIIDFNIEINAGFMSIMGADGLTRTQDSVTAANQSGAQEPVAKLTPLAEGEAPSKEPGVTPTVVKYVATKTGTDKKGGGGPDTQGTRAARLFMDALTNGTDMYDLKMTIIGDPYFIVNSGMGNYTSVQSQYKNLNADGSVNYQNGEVDIMVNFRTPIDINQTTGLYNFGKSSKSAPVIQYSGLYNITNVTSTLSGGTFKQVLEGFRRPQQENLFEATPDKTLNTSNAKVDKSDPNNTGDGQP